jgi:hypothetical protein
VIAVSVTVLESVPAVRDDNPLAKRSGATDSAKPVVAPIDVDSVITTAAVGSEKKT